ncbi:hypothetical protein [Spiroplasma endosymbiont of Apeira syringaria]|uniref:hypothetical protein n=1 Tax=Spiroplasma endosymbiont of Apeira syringaria TaxID=3066307 RepID=UPI0030CD5D82
MLLEGEIVIHHNFNKNLIIELPKEKTWKNFSRVSGDSMHRICSYVAMFSPSLADYFIQKYSEENDIVGMATLFRTIFW